MATAALTTFPAVQGAIYRVALSLDVLLVNGLQYGVLRPVADGFLQAAAGGLLADLAALGVQVRETPGVDHVRATTIMDGLGDVVRRLVEQDEELASFRGRPLAWVRLAAGRVSRLRAECVRGIQDLEACLKTPTPFYESRPAHSAAAVDAFLAGLERALAEEWGQAGEVPGDPLSEPNGDTTRR